MERDLFFDRLRGVAILCVVLIHAMTSKGSFELVIRQIIAFAVPIFIFISGYFMSNKEIQSLKEYIEFLKKRVNKVVIPYILWTIAAIGLNFVQGENLTVYKVVKMFLLGTSMTPFYFIIVILQLYLLMPLLKKLNIWVALSMNIISLVVLYILSFNGYFLKFPYYALPLTMWIGYFSLGMAIKQKKYNFKISYTLLFIIISFALSVIESIMISDFAFSTVKISSFLYSISLILFLLTIKNKFVKSIFLVKLGNYAFGIYFMHMFALIVLGKILSKINLALPLKTTIIFILAIVICYITIDICKKILPKKINQMLGFNL